MVRIPKDYHSLAGDRWPGNGRRCRTRDHENACAARLKHSISGAISFAMPLFNENPYRGLRRVIDISGERAYVFHFASNSDIARRSRHVSNVPGTDFQARLEI